MRAWDFVHCPPETKHAIIGAGDSRCTLLAVGARERQHAAGIWGAYVVDHTAHSHGAAVEEETSDEDAAYAAWPLPVPTRYGNWLLW